MGHVSRACLIYSYLASVNSYSVHFVIPRNEHAIEFIKEGIKPRYFDESIVDKNQALIQVLTSVNANILIIDTLHIKSMQDSINFTKTINCQVVIIVDNSEKKEFDVDVIVNGHPKQLDYNYENNSGKYLVGPKYFIMDTQYSIRQLTKPKETVRSILLTVGGSDHNDLMFRILNVIGKIKPTIFLLIISSKATGYSNKLKSLVENNPNPYKLLFDVPNLTPYWEQCDMAITAGGNTLFERIAIRCPGATICQLEQQMEIADTFENLGLNSNIGFGPELTDIALEEGIQFFIDSFDERLKQYEMSETFIEGKGLIYLGDKIKNLLKDVNNEL